MCYIQVMAILSIQSHVTYGFVGNKAAVFPLQSMGYDVWPINTVQFSNHTGYPGWTGDIFTGEHIRNIVQGLEKNNFLPKCQAILSGYMGSADICHAVYDSVKKLKTLNPQVIYLCDPVIGNNSCFVKPEVLDFFKTQLHADIITPNQFEAETLSDIKIEDLSSLRKGIDFFHSRNIKIVVVTGNKLKEYPDDLVSVVSDGKNCFLVKNKEFHFKVPPNGNGDLLSSLFLGQFLKSASVSDSLAFAVHYLHFVLQNTLDKQTRELQVLSTHYPQISRQILDNVIKL